MRTRLLPEPLRQILADGIRLPLVKADLVADAVTVVEQLKYRHYALFVLNLQFREVRGLLLNEVLDLRKLS